MYTKKKLFLTLLIFQCFFMGLFAQETPIKEAEVAYTKENYDKVIELYEGVLKSHGDSYGIYYNLGNAYYKVGKIPESILNYERALLINPSDKDIQFNLDIAKLKITDKIEPLGEFFLTKWFRSIQNLFSVDGWGTLGIVCFILFIGCLFLYFFSKWMQFRKIGFYAGILFLLVVIGSNIFAYNQKKAMIDRKGAIVFAPTVTIKSSPDVSGTDLFALHEGTKVFIKNTLGEWHEIELEDGNVGWVRKKDIQLI